MTICAKISSGSVDRSPLPLPLGPSFSLQCVLNVSLCHHLKCCVWGSRVAPDASTRPLL